MSQIILVGLGGALGAILRYLLSLVSIKSHFPFITLITNIIGAIVIGFVVGMFSKERISSQLQLFLKTGVCGGFTTFSTFSLESLTLLESGHYLIATAYIILSLICCLVGVFLGKYLSMKL